MRHNAAVQTHSHRARAKVVSLSDDLVADRVRRALKVLPPERLMVNPDCGLRNLPSDLARAKLRALTEGTAMVAKEG